MKKTKKMPHVVAVKINKKAYFFAFATLRQARSFLKDIKKHGPRVVTAIGVEK